MEKVKRFQIADYIDTSASGSTASYTLMGVGFNTLDENPSAQSEDSIYISEKNSTSEIKSYQTSFPFDSDLIADEDAVMALYEIGRNQKVGVDAQRKYVRVELFKPSGSGTTKFEARQFTVAVQVDSISGGGGETVKVSGNLLSVGDAVMGTFDTTTKAFTAAE